MAKKKPARCPRCSWLLKPEDWACPNCRVDLGDLMEQPEDEHLEMAYEDRVSGPDPYWPDDERGVDLDDDWYMEDE